MNSIEILITAMYDKCKSIEEVNEMESALDDLVINCAIGARDDLEE